MAMGVEELSCVWDWEEGWIAPSRGGGGAYMDRRYWLKSEFAFQVSSATRFFFSSRIQLGFPSSQQFGSPPASLILWAWPIYYFGLFLHFLFRLRGAQVEDKKITAKQKKKETSF